MDSVQFGSGNDLGYRRPPVTASFEDLRRRGLPEVLFVHSFLPEGVTICDVEMFAAMIEEAYHTPGALLVDPPDEDGNQLCRGFANNGLWEWAVITPGPRVATRITLLPERDGQREVTVAVYTRQGRRGVSGPVLAAFTISTRSDGKPPTHSPVQLGPMDAMEGMRYRRPPATVSFDDLSRRGLPRVLFVNRHLPEGVTVCDITVFAAMIRQAKMDGALRYVRPDELGNDQCVGLGSTGIWEWSVVRPSKPIDGLRYTSPLHGICRILFSPEKDGKQVCTLDLNVSPSHDPEDDSPITFTIRTRPMSMDVLESEAAAGGDPADVAEGVAVTLSWLADAIPAAAGLLRLLALLPDMPVPLNTLLYDGQRPADLPGPQAAELIEPLLNNPAAASNALPPMSLVRHAPALQVQVHPLARAAVRAQLTAQESAHWRQAGVALIEAALPADPQARASWPTYARLLPLARATLELTSDGMGRIARYLGESGNYPAARDLCRLIADAYTADGTHGPEHPDTLATLNQMARWTGMAGDAAGARDQLAALLPVTERVLGPDDPRTLATRGDLVYWRQKAADHGR